MAAAAVAGRPTPPARPARAAKPPLVSVDPAGAGADTAFARALASPDPATRARALTGAAAWLAARPDGGVPDGDMAKLWAGLFYGVSQSAVWNGKAGVVPTGRRLRPGWAWYTTLASSLAWLLASHALSRFPPLELVRAWLGPDGAPKLKPVLGALPASLRDSLKQSAGVEIV